MEQQKKRSEKKLNYIIWLLISLQMLLVFYALSSPLEGLHQIRQADTLYQAYSYCKDGSAFYLPKIIHSGSSEGVSIGELPLMSYLFSLPCKIFGEWSESLLKVLSLIVGFLSTLVWYKVFIVITQRESNLGLLKSFIFFGFLSTFSLTHLIIPIPDGFALLLCGVGVLLLQNEKQLKKLSGAMLFAIGCLVRPYLLPLGLLIGFSFANILPAALFFIVGYLIWYRYVFFTYNEINYYSSGVDQINFSSIADGLWNACIRLIRNHLHYFLIVTLIIFRKKIRLKYFLYFIISIAFVVLLKPEHLRDHGYYLTAAYVFLLFIIVEALDAVDPIIYKVMTILFLIVGIANVQHLFRHKYLDIQTDLMKQLHELNYGKNDLVETYLNTSGMSSDILYLIKLKGWTYTDKEFSGFCKNKEARFYLVNEDKKIKIKKCISN